MGYDHLIVLKFILFILIHYCHIDVGNFCWYCGGIDNPLVCKWRQNITIVCAPLPEFLWEFHSIGGHGRYNEYEQLPSWSRQSRLFKSRDNCSENVCHEVQDDLITHLVVYDKFIVINSVLLQFYSNVEINNPMWTSYLAEYLPAVCCKLRKIVAICAVSLHPW